MQAIIRRLLVFSDSLDLPTAFDLYRDFLAYLRQVFGMEHAT